MSNETSKCYDFRRKRGDFWHFLKGRGIDIGCGDDSLLVDMGSVMPWDVSDGDAELMNGLDEGSFDFVYSSHCLEHLFDVRAALSRWAELLKPGGYLYIVVPDYILYEKMQWPSMFSGDHRQSFSLCVSRSEVDRHNHWHINKDILPILLPNRCGMITASLESDGFDWNTGQTDQTLGDAVAQICFIAKKMY